MRIINLVDSLEKVNYGIWNAACFTASTLRKTYGVESEIWFPETPYSNNSLNGATPVPLLETSLSYVLGKVKERGLKATTDIIVSHGCWQYPTRIAAQLQRMGFRWMYVPHGMLEPWSLQQKFWLKKIYFTLREHPLTHKADVIRAVGEPEAANLRKFYTQTVLIPNGVPLVHRRLPKKTALKSVLFMSRLHYKKGIIPLIKAWLASELVNRPDFELLIAGPDDGELPTIHKLLQGDTLHNIKYLGAIYNDEKTAILERSSYYILPSASEGFPTSVLEAMSFGLLPIITTGCNFPSVLEQELALETEQDHSAILNTLNSLVHHTDKLLASKQKHALDFVNLHYSTAHIAKLQYEIYLKILAK